MADRVVTRAGPAGRRNADLFQRRPGRPQRQTTWETRRRRWDGGAGGFPSFVVVELGGPLAGASAVNDFGEVAGTFGRPNRATYWQVDAQGNVQTVFLPAPAAFSSQAVDINNFGEVVGGENRGDQAGVTIRVALLWRISDAGVTAIPWPHCGENSGSHLINAEFGGSMDTSRVSLCLYGPNLDPAEVTAIVGVQSTESFARGRKMRPNSTPRRRGAWMLQVCGEAPDGPEVQLRKLLEQLPRSEDVWRELGERFDVQIRFGFHMSGWNKGFVIPADLLDQLAVIHAMLNFDVYAYEDDEESED